MKLTNELIEEFDLTYSYSRKNNSDFKLIQKTLEDYDEGYVTTGYVVQNVETGDYWYFTRSSNSWDDWDYENENEEPVLVQPQTNAVVQLVDSDGRVYATLGK